MWPREELQVLLGVDYPIIQAPMAGITTPELVTAVSNAVALGALGCGVLHSGMVREQVAAVRAGTNRAFNINFFAHPKPTFDRAVAAQAHERVQRYYDELGLGTVPEPIDPFPTFDSERLKLALQLRPRVVSFHFGLPGADALRQLKQAGCVIFDLPLNFHPAAIRASTVFVTPIGAAGATGENA